MAKKVLIVGGVGGGSGHLDELYNYYFQQKDKINKLRKSDITINYDYLSNPKIIDDINNIKKYNLKFDTVYFENFPFSFVVLKNIFNICYDILNEKGKLIISTGVDGWTLIIPLISKDIGKKWIIYPCNSNKLRLMKI